MRRGVEWSTDEALWRLRALESAVWVGSLLTVKRAHACTQSWRRWRLARLACLLLPAVHWSGEVGRLKRSVWRAARERERDGEEDRKPGKAKCGGIGDTGRNKEADHGGRGRSGKLLQTWREPGGKLSVFCMPASSQHLRLHVCSAAGDRDGHVPHCRHHTLYEGDKAASRRSISFSMWPRTAALVPCACVRCRSDWQLRCSITSAHMWDTRAVRAAGNSLLKER